MPDTDDLPPGVAAARARWRWRGDERPPFAVEPGPGRRSVWDYPRPPAIVADGREVVVAVDGVVVARTRDALKVCETGHPPTWYLPPGDVDRTRLVPAPGGSFCEWKGPARYWSVRGPRGTIARAAWSYPRPLAGSERLADHVAFYASRVDCTVDGVRAEPQPGGFYGGWITWELAGPFKGEPGSEGW